MISRLLKSISGFSSYYDSTSSVPTMNPSWKCNDHLRDRTRYESMENRNAFCFLAWSLSREQDFCRQTHKWQKQTYCQLSLCCPSLCCPELIQFSKCSCGLLAPAKSPLGSTKGNYCYSTQTCSFGLHSYKTQNRIC